ncbi:helix-turn-helix transcriptional regulator [Ornithinimicrobium murale]|uniref:helix-turn-helix transcriptional regulator n=1 Tax=Ornithinimicrobium murale TaxID=1050153 RepID=UPI000E0D4772|nr:WYL domain-containing protein [Ornithinimicrobium murale]
MRRTERLHALTEALRRTGPRGRSASDLALEFGVTTRTIKRDLGALASSGLPVWSRPGPGGGYGLTERAALPPINLDATQALALLAACAVAEGAPFDDAAQAAVRKVLDVLDPATRRRAEALTGRLWVDHPPVTPRRIRSACEQALADQHTVRIRYVAADGATTDREVEPMILAQTSGRWFLIGWCRLRDAVRWFDLSRISRATTTRTPCTGHDISEIGQPPASARAVGPGEVEGLRSPR